MHHRPLMRLSSHFGRIIFLLTAAILAAPHAATGQAEGLFADIETAHGTITAQLFFEQAPLPVANFVGLAEGSLGPAPGKPFYDGLSFHRVVPGFVIQGGDPAGDGTGGPGYRFRDQFIPGLRHDGVGILSMANSGPDTNGSQFFITLAAARRLDYLHSVFGRVIQGIETLPRITTGDTMHVRIRRVGQAAQAFRADPEHFQALQSQVPTSQPPYFDDPDRLLPQEPAWSRIINHRLANFERFTQHRIFIRLSRVRASDEADRPLADIVRRLASRGGAERGGIAVVHFASSAEWGLWVSPEAMSAFSSSANQEEVQTEFLEAVQQAAAALENEVAPSARSPERRLKFQVDEIINEAIERLERVGRSTHTVD
jgi:cyclophilin family peptidyl-prolyl cis-trans isomerase